MHKSVIYSKNKEFLPKNMELKKEELHKALNSKKLVLKMVNKGRTYRKCRRVLFVAEAK